MPTPRKPQTPHAFRGTRRLAAPIANVRLPEGLTSDVQIGRALRELCAAPLAEREQRQGGGGPYYGFPIGPYLQYYKEGMREATCTMTVSDRQHGRELTGHLR